MIINRQTLSADGFKGFRSFAELDLKEVPQVAGIYAVLLPDGFVPQFLSRSAGGHFKGKDPSLPVSALATKWVEGAGVLYIGKAASGKTGKRGLRKRTEEFADFGRGKPVGHWGGRLLWQLVNSQTLLIAWKELAEHEVNAAEAHYHAEFLQTHGQLPFANLVQARMRIR